MRSLWTPHPRAIIEQGISAQEKCETGPVTFIVQIDPDIWYRRDQTNVVVGIIVEMGKDFFRRHREAFFETETRLFTGAGHQLALRVQRRIDRLNSPPDS